MGKGLECLEWVLEEGKALVCQAAQSQATQLNVLGDVWHFIYVGECISLHPSPPLYPTTVIWCYCSPLPYPYSNNAFALKRIT